jgi:hypothetical protein
VNDQAAAALLRLSAMALVALAVGMVLAVFAAGAATADGEVGLATVQDAVFFFGPLAAIAMLALIIVLALTRPPSLRIRRRATRGVAVAYAIVGIAIAVGLRGTWWVALGGAITALSAGLAWWLLGRPTPA